MDFRNTATVPSFQDKKKELSLDMIFQFQIWQIDSVLTSHHPSFKLHAALNELVVCPHTTMKKAGCLIFSEAMVLSSHYNKQHKLGIGTLVLLLTPCLILGNLFPLGSWISHYNDGRCEICIESS